MKNKNIDLVNEEAKIYRDHYRPSLNLFRSMRSILGVFLFGSSTVASSYVPARKRMLK
jgi:hypothetical protein